MLHVVTAVKAVAKAAKTANDALDWALDKRITLTLTNTTRRDAMIAVCVIPIIGPSEILSTSLGWEFLRAGDTTSGVHSRGAGIWCQLMAGSGGSQGFPSMTARMASSAAMPWAAAESR